MPRHISGMIDVTEADLLSGAEAAVMARGSCDIRLLADRVPSLKAGSTHKVYRGWRFVVVMQHGHPRPGTTLFTVPVDAARLATSQSRYALVQLATPGATAAEDVSAFSWAALSIGTADPFAAAQEQTRRQLNAVGWTQDTATPTHYTRPGSFLALGEKAMMPPSTAAHVVELGVAPVPLTAGTGHRSMAMPPQREIAGLDGWETGGGTTRNLSDRLPRRADIHR